jgi:aryl-alcohol dehydrogenase-like predicted oxidoreductase
MSKAAGDADRRRVLAWGAGLAASAWIGGSPAGAEEQTGAAALITRKIPHSGEAVPVIGLGTSEVFDIGNDAAERRACAEVIRRLIDGGGSVIDTAPSYGRAEAVVGDLVAETGLRGRAFLATKLEAYDRATGPGEFRASLQRLHTDKVDLMQLHNVSDPKQNLALLREWKAQGLCRYIGITTSFGGDFDAVEAVLKREKPDFLEVNYSLADRDAEQRVLPAAAEVGAAVLVDLPLARGRLFRAVRGKPLPDWAKDIDAASWAQVFLKYILGHPAITAVIPGTSNPEHMADDLGAGRGRLPDEAQRRKMVAFFQSL